MTSQAAVAFISSACRFPDATSPGELWSNIMEGRRSFRAIPRERIDLSRHSPELVGDAESITPIRAGLLANWTFDRTKFRIPEKTFAVADLSHWLALELASDALAAIGGPERLDRPRTAVVVANTMAGEFARAALLPLRLPFLDTLLAEAAEMEGLSSEGSARLRTAFSAKMRERFLPPNEESLAGGLANTIAGRIANYFDFGGGAYSVDGACASSLVALANGADLLVSGQAEAVLVTAVDLSLDPFELVGFSRNGALAASEMRVFDANANGFWPGEGGACVILMREENSKRHNFPMLARLRGWGISSDGAGGLTRPSSDGQLAAYRRACAMAAVDPADIAFVEAHGTGTAVGDPIEVRALAELREGASSPLPIGSVKANIGHTKAAAGLAGLIKALEALRNGIIPPHVGCDRPHPVFAAVDGRVRPILAPEALDERRPALAGISSFGFGGINVHALIEAAGTNAARGNTSVRAPVAQAAELFLFAGADAHDVIEKLDELHVRAASLSMSELVDAAAYTAEKLIPGPLRVAVVASNGPELASRLAIAKSAVGSGTHTKQAEGLFIGRSSRPPRIGFLFPGQGAPCRPHGGCWSRRFGEVAQLTRDLTLKNAGDPTATEIVQPSVIAASLAALGVLERHGVTATIATGHSLGEIAALAWAGALDPAAALTVASTRGEIMAREAIGGGAMLRVGLPVAEAQALVRSSDCVVACQNGAREVVIAGAADRIAMIAAHCADRQVEAQRLSVSHAFHSPDMRPAAAALSKALAHLPFNPLIGEVVSTVTGGLMEADTDLRAILIRQLTSPVLFDLAVDIMSERTDLLVEVGPGRGLTRLAEQRGLRAVSVDAFDETLLPLLHALAALFVAGAPVRAAAPFADRMVRPFDPGGVDRFISNPCGTRDTDGDISTASIAPAAASTEAAAFDIGGAPLNVVLAAVASEIGLPVSQIAPDDRFLDSLRLNSLAVTRIVSAAARTLQARIPSAPTEFANVTPRILAEALAEMKALDASEKADPERVAGVRSWVRAYGFTWREAPVRPAAREPLDWRTVAITRDHQGGISPDTKNLLIWIDGPFGSDLAERLILTVGAAAAAQVRHLAICNDGAPVSAFARSVCDERHFQSVRVIDRAGAAADDARIASALSAHINTYDEIRLAARGGIEEPVFLPTEPACSASAALRSDDVVVVVGGGKGIAAECALRIARRGAAVILVGRSSQDDPDVAATLVRARRQKLRCQYVRADVLDPERLGRTFETVLRRVGPATWLIYAPGVNEPKRITEIDRGTAQRVLAPKTYGLAATLDALGPSLRRLITFGSVIGRIGLEGEAHYALANAMQSAATEAWGAGAPGRAPLAIEWSLWGGAGMGERLGTIERLSSRGVDAVSIDDALAAFDRLLDDGAVGAVAITSRFGAPANLAIGEQPLPILRFLDEPKVHFPGVELVVDTELSRARDPYLADHVIDDASVLPAVFALEAMAQAASALIPLDSAVTITNAEFRKVVRLAASDRAPIRIAALRTGETAVDVHLSCADDAFASPCVQATFETAATSLPEHHGFAWSSATLSAEPLYGPLFFNDGRFHRIADFGVVGTRAVSARLSQPAGVTWFGPYEAQSLVLWDPGAADAALHALQIAVPHRRVIPVSIGRIDIGVSAGPPAQVTALERLVYADNYVFDILVRDSGGRVAQSWRNVTFRVVGSIDIDAVLMAEPKLAACYLERLARETFGNDTIAVSLVDDRVRSREARHEAALAALGLNGKVDRRTDGRPIHIESSHGISLSHRDPITVAVTAEGSISCDIEPVDARGRNRTGADPIRRHILLELCRKLGQRTPLSALGACAPGANTSIGNVDALVIEIPMPSGIYNVGFGRLRTSVPHSYASEAAR